MESMTLHFKYNVVMKNELALENMFNLKLLKM
jgi:hypothetical protein